MNWDAASAVGEIVGALAVVVSVIYLAAQVRKQTEEAKLSATRDLATQGDQIIDRINSDLTLTSVYRKGVQHYNQLTDDERLWTALIFQRFTRVMEQQIMHLEKENSDPIYFESFRRVFFEGVRFPGYQQWWQNSASLFGDDFQDYVNSLIVEAKAKGYESSFKKPLDGDKSGT